MLCTAQKKRNILSFTMSHFIGFFSSCFEHINEKCTVILFKCKQKCRAYLTTLSNDCGKILCSEKKSLRICLSPEYCA